LPGVRIVEQWAFFNCCALSDVEFGDKLETIGERLFAGCRSLRSIKIPYVRTVGSDAFNGCHSLQKIKMPYVRTIGSWAFLQCEQLTDVELPCVETMGPSAFIRCVKLRRVAIPLKDNMFVVNNVDQRCTQFGECENLTAVDLLGGMHNTVYSLLLESWKDEINQEIDRINEVLPNIHHTEKTNVIQGWIRSVIDRIQHYKAEHNTLLKEDMTQLELAVWKANLDENEEVRAKKAKIDVESVRNERRIKSGASIIIGNVLPFLMLR
jgi:hypothetical protein